MLVLAAAGVIGITLLGALGFAGGYVYLAPSLPSVEEMRRFELQVPLRVYTRSGELIAQIGIERRIPVTYEQIPEVVREAFLAAEDDRFFEHGGVDLAGIVRAVFVNLIEGSKSQGASTITQQVARTMFLTRDKTWRRKLAELFLTLRMEREFTKEQIFTLYLNVIFFGQRAYGVAAAAETYFGKPLDRLTVAEAAMLAGIPQAPSRYNPLVNPELVKARRAYVIGRMRELGFIDDTVAQAAANEPIEARAHAPLYEVEAPYVAEMARLEVRRRFGSEAESAGYKVFTTIDGRLQTAANRAVRLGLIEYDRRHGWRGPVARIEADAGAAPEELDDLLAEYPSVGNLVPAVVAAVNEKSVRVYVKSTGFAQIEWDGLAWARPALRNSVVGPEPKSAGEIVSAGDVVYVITDGQGAAQLAQIPDAQGALVALDPNDGAIAALVGGFDYFQNKFNRVTQARRQPGSAFKPFLYSAALENGFTPASVILDAPIVQDDAGMEVAWRPENSSRTFYGPTRLREALVRSRNLVTIRLLRALGIPTAIDYASRFGFEKSSLPANLTLALGTMQATPLELAAAYCTFANGGFRIEPYFIDRIEDAEGNVVWRAEPRIACPECEQPLDVSDMIFTAGSADALTVADSVRGGRGFLPAERLAPRVISPQNAWLMTDMMADVIRRGTGRRALALGRSDIAGKTGTSNEARDTWFNGYTPNLVATVWVGFDQERSLGEGEEGGRTALPVWVHFMREALKGVPQERHPMPPGLITLRISPDTGTLASAENPYAVLETFMVDHLPAGTTDSDASSPEEIPTSDTLF